MKMVGNDFEGAVVGRRQGKEVVLEAVEDNGGNF